LKIMNKMHFCWAFCAGCNRVAYGLWSQLQNYSVIQAGASKKKGKALSLPHLRAEIVVSWLDDEGKPEFQEGRQTRLASCPGKQAPSS